MAHQPISYLSVQYSAIQKTILRHDRLWSIAGISHKLSWLNEIRMPEIAEAKANKGTVLVAGGGKFTAKFSDGEKAKQTKEQIEKDIAVHFPMLEFQITQNPIPASTLKKAKEEGLIEELNDQKKRFRGYGVSYNPHFKVCKECGEYPAVQLSDSSKTSDRMLCRICSHAKLEAQIDLKALNAGSTSGGNALLTTPQKIYQEYLKGTEISTDVNIPLNFEDLFPGEEEQKRKRMAVWFSDINNMNDKVPIWLSRDNEKEIRKIFAEVKNVNVKMITKALVQTFSREPLFVKKKKRFLPFRIIVAGGDDLCLVTSEKYIVNFAKHFSETFDRKKPDNAINNCKYLTSEWLEEERKKLQNEDTKKKFHSNKPIQPYGFGGSFIVTSIHTPFRKIHAVGEELMKQAKQATDRQGNSVNWRIMAEEDSLIDQMLSFEKPLFIDQKIEKVTGMPWNKLPLTDYLNLIETVDSDGQSETVSSTLKHRIISKMIEYQNPVLLERWLKGLSSAEMEKKGLALILQEEKFREKGALHLGRLATFFELLSIEGDKGK